MLARFILLLLLCAAPIGSFIIGELPARAVTPSPTPTPPPAPESNPYEIPRDPNKLDLTSPQAIQLFIDQRPSVDTARIWERLGIEHSFNGLRGWNKPASFMATCDYCHADLYTFDLDDDPGDEVILRVASGIEECRYLIFKSNGEWVAEYRLLGSIDHSFGRYEMPSHYFVVGAGQPFLAIKVQTQSGSGVAMYKDRLFALVHGKLVEVMDFPHEGHDDMVWMTGRNFDGRIGDVRRAGSDYLIRLDLRVRYDLQQNDREITWDKKQFATFRWHFGGDPAVFLPQRSTLTKQELYAVYDVDTLSDKEFERYNRAEIRKYGVSVVP